MKIIIKRDSNQNIIGYQCGPFEEDSKDPRIQDISAEEFEQIKLQFNQWYEQNSNITKMKELNELESWFKWYDTQSIQYERDMRLYQKSNIDINVLDKQAIVNANRIKELRIILQIEPTYF